MEPRSGVRRRALWVAGAVIVVGLAILALSIHTVLQSGRPARTPSPAPGRHASVSIRPSIGGVGTYVSIVGEGWAPGSTVRLYLAPPQHDEDAIDYGDVPVGADGSFVAAVTIPDDRTLLSLGVVRVVADQATSRLKASASFQVELGTETPIPTREPTSTPSAVQPTSTATPDATATTTRIPSATAAASPTPTSAPIVFSGWRGEYYANNSLSGEPALVRDDANVQFDWGAEPPAIGLPSTNFSVRWTRRLQMEAGTYHFGASADDGIRLVVDGVILIEEWHDGAGQEYSAVQYLAQGEHTVIVEYFQRLGEARVSLAWGREDRFPAWKAEYYDSMDLQGSPVLVSNDDQVDFDWGSGSPTSLLSDNTFSARWTRSRVFLAGDYRFFAYARDGVRVWLDDTLVIDEWHAGTDTTYAADVKGVSAGTHEITVAYYHQTGTARVRVVWDMLATYQGWKGEYFDNRDLRGQPVLVRDDAQINFGWGLSAPATQVPQTRFSVRWTRSVQLAAGTYRFSATLDDGMRVWFDSWLVIDDWNDGSARSQTATFEGVTAGLHIITVEYYQLQGEAQARFSYELVQ